MSCCFCCDCRQSVLYPLLVVHEEACPKQALLIDHQIIWRMDHPQAQLILQFLLQAVHSPPSWCLCGTLAWQDVATDWRLFFPENSWATSQILVGHLQSKYHGLGITVLHIVLINFTPITSKKDQMRGINGWCQECCACHCEVELKWLKNFWPFTLHSWFAIGSTLVLLKVVPNFPLSQTLPAYFIAFSISQSLTVPVRIEKEHSFLLANIWPIIVHSWSTWKYIGRKLPLVPKLTGLIIWFVLHLYVKVHLDNLDTLM